MKKQTTNAFATGKKSWESTLQTSTQNKTTKVTSNVNIGKRHNNALKLLAKGMKGLNENR